MFSAMSSSGEVCCYGITISLDITASCQSHHIDVHSNGFTLGNRREMIGECQASLSWQLIPNPVVAVVTMWYVVLVRILVKPPHWQDGPEFLALSHRLSTPAAIDMQGLPIASYVHAI